MLCNTRPNKGAGRPTNEERKQRMFSRRKQELPLLNTELKIYDSEVRRNENPTIYVGQLIQDLGNMYLFLSSTPGQYRQCFSKVELATGILRYNYLDKLAN